jgi:membrane-associated HD superfamily phosphohydrolase
MLLDILETATRSERYYFNAAQADAMIDKILENAIRSNQLALLQKQT